MTKAHDEQTVDRVAFSIWNATKGKFDTWQGASEGKRDQARRQARAALSAMPPQEVLALPPQEVSVQVVNARPDDYDDATLLDELSSNYWDLKCIEIPTGGGDADVDWIVVEHHMGKKGDVVVAQAYCDDPRKAIIRALSEGKA